MTLVAYDFDPNEAIVPKNGISSARPYGNSRAGPSQSGTVLTQEENPEEGG